MRFLVVLGMTFLTLAPTAGASEQKQLEVKTSSTGYQYLAYGGEPLLAYGPGDESLLISRDDPDAVRRWAKWQRDNGMNLLRAYPTSVPGAISRYVPKDWKAVPQMTDLHPFKQKDGKWDVDAWNGEYFENMSRFFSILAEYDIVVHLQLWQVCWFKEDRPERWESNYINPRNNINEWTRAYPRGVHYMNAPSDSPAGKHRREWVTRLLDSVKGHGNVWIDVINELENGGIGSLEWAREVVGWIREWEEENGQELLVGVHMVNFNHDRFKPCEGDYDILIFGETHRGKVPRAIREFRKPAVTVRSSDGSNRLEDLIFLDAESVGPEYQTRYRTLVYRSIFNGVQSIGAYWKPDVSVADYMDMEDWTRYSRALRKICNRIAPFRPDLVMDDDIVKQNVTPYAYGMKSDRLYLVYLECGSHTWNNSYPASTIRVSTPFESFRIEVFDPRTGRSRLGKGVREGDEIVISVPEFVDDQVILIWAR